MKLLKNLIKTIGLTILIWLLTYIIQPIEILIIKIKNEIEENK